MNGQEINNTDLNVDRGLELLLSHGRKPQKIDNRLLSFNIRLFSFDLSFSIKKSSREDDPCKKHSSQ